jgi:hypothetical protein
MREVLFSTLAITFALTGPVSNMAAQDPMVQSILGQMSIDSLMHFTRQLSGELPVDIGGGPQLIVSRHKNHPGNDMAQVWIGQKLAQWGYTPVVQTFSATGKNVLVTKPGTINGAPAVIMGAHFDAMPGGVYNAPGADDNGSGTAAVLEAARIMAGHGFEHPVIFAFWDEEEQGLIGSAFHAAGLASNDVLLRAVVNVDAIAYDGNGDTKARVHSRPIGNSHEIKDTVMAMLTHYGIELDLIPTIPGATYSDHASFWNEQYGAVLIIEDFTNDGNPFYHTPNDKVEHFDVPYFEKLARLSLATVATLAVPADAITGLLPSEELRPDLQVWPNPATTEAFVWVGTSTDGPMRVTLLDGLGREVMVLYEGAFTAGKRSFTVPMGGLSAGSYFLKATGTTGTATLQVVRMP